MSPIVASSMWKDAFGLAPNTVPCLVHTATVHTSAKAPTPLRNFEYLACFDPLFFLYVLQPIRGLRVPVVFTFACSICNCGVVISGKSRSMRKWTKFRRRHAVLGRRRKGGCNFKEKRFVER